MRVSMDGRKRLSRKGNIVRTDVIKVFVGASEVEWLPAQVLAHSIYRRTKRDVEVVSLCDVNIPIPMPKDPTQRPVTNFSFQRFLIPQALGYQGKGIYLDSDMICRGDIGELWDHPFAEGMHVQMCPCWSSACMLIDSKCGWSIAGLVSLIDTRVMTYNKLMKVVPLGECVASLPQVWNAMDRPGPMDVEHGKILHYTNMDTQPWLKRGHVNGALWSSELLDAIAQGWITREDVLEQIRKGHVRPSLALTVGEEQPYDDSQFVLPHHRRKAAV